nr:hypothetical protein [uncultured Desulfobacter sp.]
MLSTKTMKRLLTILSFIILFSGCSTVVSKNPVGLKPFAPSKEQIEGIWLSDNETIKIKLINESEGIIKFAWIEDKASDFKLETVTGKLLKGNKGVYINALGQPGDDFGGYYIWGKIQFKDHKIIIWPPSFESFKLAFENNKIKAIVEKNDNGKITDIKLIDKPKGIIDLIENNSSFFDWENPIILIKMSF